MEAATVVEVLFRWMHILAAITAVGGTIFMRLALVPAVSVLSDDEHAKLREALRSNWAKWVHISIASLLVSGFYNYLMVVMPKHDTPKFYHPLFGVKFLLALAIFGIASLLMGKSEAAGRFRKNARYWLSVNMTLAILLICISGILKVSHGPPASVTVREVGPASRTELDASAARLAAPTK